MCGASYTLWFVHCVCIATYTYVHTRWALHEALTLQQGILASGALSIIVGWAWAWRPRVVEVAGSYTHTSVALVGSHDTCTILNCCSWELDLANCLWKPCMIESGDEVGLLDTACSALLFVSSFLWHYSLLPTFSHNLHCLCLHGIYCIHPAFCS